MFLVPFGSHLEWFGCGCKHCCIMIHVSSLGSKSKSLSSWPFGSSIFASFVKSDENKDFVTFTPSASIWKFGMKLQSKPIYRHPLWIISFLLQIYVHAWNNQPHSLGLIANMQSTFGSFFFHELIFDGVGCPHVKLFFKCMLEWVLDDHICMLKLGGTICKYKH